MSCVTTSLKRNEDGQQLFSCLICEAHEYKGHGINYYARNIVEKSLKKGLLVTCDKHKDQSAEFFCVKDKAMICKDCVLFGHIQHITECKPIQRDLLIRYIKKSLKKLYAKNQ